MSSHLHDIAGLYRQKRGEAVNPVVKHWLTTAMAIALSACATTGAPVIVKVPIPIACAVATPARPAMPTETLPARPLLDTLVQAALAEIELREGYEGELLTALEACKQTPRAD